MLIVAFGESTMSTTQVQLQYKRFKAGREDLNDNARPDRPSMSTTDENIDAVKKMILDNRRITIRQVADHVSILFGSCQVVFTDVLDIKRAAAKIVPKLLNFEQTQRRMDIAQEMCTTFNNDSDLLKKIITGGKSWVYGYDIEIKAQSKPNPNGNVQMSQNRKK